MKQNIWIRTLILISGISVLVSITSCKKSFLEEPKPATSVSEVDVYGSELGVRSYFNGLYRELRTQWGTSTDAWGIVSVLLAREAKGVDLSLPGGNWYNFDYLHDNREPTYRRVVFTWDYFYNFINKLNNLIAGVESSQLTDVAKKQLLAEAKAFRAWCYFELVQEFAVPYSQNPDAPGVPIYNKPTSAVTEGQPRAKLSEVYDFILEDLNYAVANASTTRANGGLKDIINKNVANGILARVALEMGTRGNNTTHLNTAVTAAQAARTGYALNRAQNGTSFSTDFSGKTEVIWGFPQAADQTIYYGSPSAFFGTSGVGYFNFFVDSNFVNTFTSTDIRKSLFVAPGGTSFTGLRKWKTNKFGTTTNFTDFIICMRSSEMILIEAEAKARLGSSDASTVLFTLQSNRDPQAVLSSKTGEGLIDEILLEKRKDLFGEIGVGYLDLRRTGRSLVRSNGHVSTAIITIPGADVRWTLKIPQKEFDSNPAFSSADQNP